MSQPPYGPPGPQRPQYQPPQPPKRNPLTWVLAGGVAVLVVLLVVLLVVITGSDDNDAGETAALNGTPAASESAETSESTAAETCADDADEEIINASWSKTKSTTPSYAIVLQQVIELPSAFAPMAQETSPFTGYEVAFGTSGSRGVVEGLHQAQDGSIIAVYHDTSGSTQQVAYAIISADGAVTSDGVIPEKYSEWPIPKDSDLMRIPKTGYHRVTAADGIQIPAAARGDEDEKNFILAALPDVMDKEVVWVLMRGGTQLYKASVCK